MEEALQKKIAEQECYTELAEIIIGAITDLSDACDMTKEHETYIEKINGMIDFMRERGLKPGCKRLTRETKYSDFIYAENDAETMKSARDIVNSKMKGNKLVKQCKTKHDREVRAKNKAKQRETLGKTVGRIPHTTQRTKRSRNKLNHLHGLQHHGNISIHKGTVNHRVRTQHIKNRYSTENHDNTVWSRHPKRSTRQHTYI